MNNIFGWSFECQSNKLIPAVFNDLNDFMSSVETAADLEGIPHRQYVVGLTSITDIVTVHNQIKDKLIDFIRITTNAEAVNLNQLFRKVVDVCLSTRNILLIPGIHLDNLKATR